MENGTQSWAVLQILDASPKSKPGRSLVPVPSLTIAPGTLVMEAADGVSPGGLHTSADHAVHLLFHLWVSPLHSPKVQVTGVVSLHLGERSSAQWGWVGALTPHPCTGPGHIRANNKCICSYSYLLVQMKQLRPQLQSYRQGLQPLQHPCLQGRRAESEHWGSNQKKCEDEV